MNNTDREIINSIFTENYYKIYNLHILYILNLVFFILHNLNIVDYIKSNLTTYENLMEYFNFHPQAKCSIIWMLDFLEEIGYLERKIRDGKTYFKIKNDIPYSNQDQLANQILELDKNWRPSIELMNNIALNYEYFLKGNKSGLELLFGEERNKLWNDYFNNTFSGYEVFNILGAYGVSKWILEARIGRFLELGSGTAGATIKLFEKFKENKILDKIEEYIFSDISPVFLRLGNRLIIEKFPDFDKITLKKIDFNKPFYEQKIENESIDLVYAVNALHVSKDLLFTLKEIYKSLRYKGILVISELIRPFERYVLCQEFIFNLLENYYNVDLDPNLRPIHGFLTPNYWKKNFEAAGFKSVDLISNIKYDLSSFSFNTEMPLFALAMKAQKEDR